MAESGERGGFNKGFGRGGGDRGGRGGGGRGGGRGRGGREGGGDRPPRSDKPRGRGDDEKEWVPITKLGRLVKDRKIRSLEHIYLFSMPVKEYQIIDFFLPTGVLKDEVMHISPVQKQTRAGQRTRFKAFVACGDFNGHLGLANKTGKEVATAIRGALILAKLSVIPVRRGYWGNKVERPHTVPCKITGKSGSVRVRLIPAPRGAGIVASTAPKRVLAMAGINDVYTSTEGNTKTIGNTVKATFNAIKASYSYLTPEFWTPTVFSKAPFQEYSDFLAKSAKVGNLRT